MNNKIKIKFENLFAGYDKTLILKNVNFEIKDKDFIAILGENGAGKTTLINAIFDICKIQKGKILFNNYDKNSVSKSFYDNVAAVPQKINLMHNFLVDDFINFGFSSIFDKIRFNENFEAKRKEFSVNKKFICEMLGIEKFLHKRINEVSAGEMKRILIAQSLVKKPKILFLDECLANLDMKFQIEILKLLKKMNNLGTTVVAIIHNINLAYNFFDKIIFMKNGELVETFEKFKNLQTVETFRKEKFIFLNSVKKAFDLSDDNFKLAFL